MFGWLGQRYAEFRSWNTDQTQCVFVVPEDSRDYLDMVSRKEIVRRIEWLLQSFPMVKEGGRGLARHAIGKGLTLQLNTPNLQWNAEIEDDFEQYAITPGRFDLAGRRNFYDGQPTAVEQRIWRGEFFASATENPRWLNTIAGQEVGEPCWQLWDTNEIETPDGVDAEKLNIFDGVKLDEFSNPLGYYVKARNPRKWDFIPAAAMVHWYAPTGINQVRGESDFAPAIKRIVDWNDLEKLFVMHSKTQSSMAIAVKKLARVGGRGIANRIAEKTARATGCAVGPTVDTEAIEKAFPGRVAYLGADGEAQMLSPNSPGDKLEPFLSNLISPSIFAAIGVPSEFFWDPSKLTSASQRFVLSRADLTFQLLADSLIYRWCNAVAFRYISHRIAAGKVPAPPVENWAATMTWQMPQRITIDNGRDGNLAIQLVGQGMDNLRGWYDRNGKAWRHETRQWIREFIEFREMAKAEGADPALVAELMQRWRPLMPGAGGGPNESNAQDKKGTPSEAEKKKK